jgi:hypothetical protein
MGAETIRTVETHALDPHPRRWHPLHLLGLLIAALVAAVAMPSLRPPDRSRRRRRPGRDGAGR